MLLAAAYVALAAVATGVVWAGSDLLEEMVDRLGAYYGIPAIVQGAVIAAIGSSTPELSSAVIATLVHGEFELGVAAIVGSAVFNILVIPAAATLAGAGALQSGRELVYKEAQFYLISVAVLLLTFSFAVIYYPAEADLAGTLTPGLALLPLAFYGLYIFIQYLDTRDYEPADAPPDENPWRLWGFLLVSLIVIVVGVEGLVRAAIGLGDIFGTPSFIWGLTVVAAGTSLPDTFVSVKAAQRGNDVGSMANVFGSNIFDLLVAIPVAVILAGAVPIDFTVAVPMMAFLVFATIALFTIIRTDFELTEREAYTLLALYAIFVAWLLLETFGVTGFVL